jgi:hypothetical protein
VLSAGGPSVKEIPYSYFYMTIGVLGSDSGRGLGLLSNGTRGSFLGGKAAGA